ncbi:hypothetical protein Cgig2_023136 [Carnegiea gigantea]|uniref:Uncharacterized protein n=1 Tax=Carnegiea gigantea TaxID=171969 RepID=A0A9Q1GH51_9CARY|nr:hypothetical protein Cgig2_023136 [Carnegiea gigantea]
MLKSQHYTANKHCQAQGKERHGKKTDSSSPARHEAVKQTKPVVHGEGGKQTPKHAATNQPGQQQQKLALNARQAADSNKPKPTKVVLPKKDHGKRVGAARTPEKSEEVDPSDALRKREPKNLPLAYCSPFVTRPAKLNIEDVDDSEPLFDAAIRRPLGFLWPL